jgi:2-polyprenyl-6-methoxyphenol hydroxylase-like FAD-dependent oxidoreductase
MYGYANHRVWRSVLLDEMKQMLAERSIRIEYNSRFSGIISDDEDRVDFQINDEACHASLLIGMDGIYSTVRKYLAPDVQPEYTGVMGVLSHIKRDSVAWPHEDYERNATIQDVPGAIFFLPEDPDNIDIMIGLQKRAPESSREDLEHLQQDKTKLVEFYRERYDEWGPTARSIIDRVTENKDSCFIWPFLRVPTLSSWYSDTGRIVLCGDAAHGLPPSSGQGINQALEDVYSLTLLLTSAGQQSSTNSQANGVNNGNSSKSLEALAFWQDMRQKRIDAVFDWVTNTTNVQRMSDEERRKIIEEGKFKGGAASDNMSWLFTPALEGDVQAWIAAHA